MLSRTVVFPVTRVDHTGGRRPWAFGVRMTHLVRTLTQNRLTRTRRRSYLTATASMAMTLSPPIVGRTACGGREGWSVATLLQTYDSLLPTPAAD